MFIVKIRNVDGKFMELRICANSIEEAFNIADKYEKGYYSVSAKAVPYTPLNGLD